MHLRCSNRSCAAVQELHARALACPRCGDLLEVVVEHHADPGALKRLWRQRRTSNDPRDLSGVWRFREFLPDTYGPDGIVTMGEGNTRLVRGQRTAEWAGARNIQFKHLGWNPTLSFKDLGMTAGVTEAKYQGAKVVACASTGNTAASMAAYAARAGMTARVYLPAGMVSLAKVAQSMDYGAELVQIEGSFDLALETMLNNPDPNVYFLNSINPFRIEGQKTTIYELMEQLDWKEPDFIVCPGGNLGNSSAFGKALEELKANGLIEKVPRMIVVQAHGANPFYRTWKKGLKELEVVANPETVATAIRIGAPKSWKKALRTIEFTNGIVMEVTDEEIGEAKTMIGRDGIGCEPASATTLAGVRKLIAQQTIDPDATIVALLTGHSLKDTDYIIKSRQKQAEELAGVSSH
ncbi:MAG: threonine synthase [Terriglobales bacterium]